MYATLFSKSAIVVEVNLLKRDDHLHTRNQARITSPQPTCTYAGQCDIVYHRYAPARRTERDASPSTSTPLRALHRKLERERSAVPSTHANSSSRAQDAVSPSPDTHVLPSQQQAILEPTSKTSGDDAPTQALSSRDGGGGKTSSCARLADIARRPRAVRVFVQTQKHQ